MFDCKSDTIARASQNWSTKIYDTKPTTIQLSLEGGD